MKRVFLAKSKEEFEGNALGDLAAVLGGGDSGSQIDAIKETLSAEKRINEISNSIDQKEKEWNQRIADLSNKDKLAKLQAEIKSIKMDKKKPWVAIKQYKEAAKKIKATVSEYKNAVKLIKKDVGEFRSNFGEIDDLVKGDVAALKNRFKIPDINVADFSMGLFGKMFQTKVASFKKYSAIAKEYMPPKKTAEEKAQKKLVPRKRGKGRDYKFAITTGYPTFWLKQAGISSKDDGSAFSGDIEGELKNFSTHPDVIKTPSKVSFKGDFKGQNVTGIDITAVINNLNQASKTTVKGVVNRYLVSGVNLSQSESLEFGIGKAQGKTNIDAVMDGDMMDVKINNIFSAVDYKLESKNKNV